MDKSSGGTAGFLGKGREINSIRGKVNDRSIRNTDLGGDLAAVVHIGLGHRGDASPCIDKIDMP